MILYAGILFYNNSGISSPSKYNNYKQHIYYEK